MYVVSCPQEHFNQILSVMSTETCLGQAAPLVVAAEAILAACPHVVEVEAEAEGTLGGPLMSCHAQKKPQLPSSPRRASCSCGLSCLSVFSPEGLFLSCHVLSCLSSPGGLLIPPNYPREKFLGGRKGSGWSGRAKGRRPRRPPAMAS